MGVVPSWVPVVELAMVIVTVGSLGVIRWLDRTRDWGRIRRSRLLLGVPWGTLVSIVGVLCVYLFVQGGWSAWYQPVTIAFRSWSYFYPSGMLLAPFSHNGPGHLTGNLIGALVLGSLAEFAWGHYPDERGRSVFSSPLSNPYVRAFLVFPLGVFVVGFGTVVFGWGPIIGFSGVVFAFAGFAVLRYPLVTIIALEVRQLVEVVYYSVADPVVVSNAEPQFVWPWWAGVAVQGHLLGLLLGILFGVVVVRRRDVDVTKIWVGVLLLGTSLTIWAVWWYGGGTEYILYRGIGVILVLGVAIVVTLGARASWSDRMVSDVPVRAVGVLVIVLPVLVMGFVAVPFNLSTVGDSSPPVDGSVVSVRDYSVSYAENITDEHVSIVNLSVFGETTSVRRSGVIVVSRDRHVWQQAVSASRLAFAGELTVRVGGVGWGETVGVKRTGWVAENNETAYIIELRPPDGEWQIGFLSEPAVAEPRVAGYGFVVTPGLNGFTLGLVRNSTVVDRIGMPSQNATVPLGRFDVVVENESMYVVDGGTRVRVARKETYN